MTSIAVVILNWNGAEMLRRFLPSVTVHADSATRVIVADNGSTDASEAVVKDFPSVEWLPLGENYGFAEGYNRALAQVEADYYLLLNSDVEVSPDWLQPLRSYMDSHPETAACQPKLLDWKDKQKFEYAGGAGGYIDRYGYPYCRGRIFTDIETDCGQYDGAAWPVLWATGAALMIRSEAWRDAGGLDGSFFAHMEEIDLCWRLRARGKSIVCVPESRVYHVGGATLNKDNPRKTFLNFRNNLLLLYKNLPEADLRPVMRLRRFLDYVAALKFLLSGETGNARAVIRARREFRRIRSHYTAARQENLRKATGQVIPEIMQKSLLWQYYAKGKKTFTQLHPQSSTPHA